MAYGCNIWFLGKLTVYPESVFIRNSTDQWRIRSAYESICLVIGFKVKPIGRKFSKRQGVLLDSSLSRQQQQQLDAIFTSRHLNWGQNDFFFSSCSTEVRVRVFYFFSSWRKGVVKCWYLGRWRHQVGSKPIHFRAIAFAFFKITGIYIYLSFLGIFSWDNNCRLNCVIHIRCTKCQPLDKGEAWKCVFKQILRPFELRDCLF
jgi:hypothetical protein